MPRGERRATSDGTAEARPDGRSQAPAITRHDQGLPLIRTCLSVLSRQLVGLAG